MHISGLLKTEIKKTNADIQETKANIEDIKADIEKPLTNLDGTVFDKTVRHIIDIYEECEKETVFGRSLVEKVTGLGSTRASEILKLMLNKEIIEAVTGFGKGKYRFK